MIDINGTLEDAMEALAARAAELRTSPVLLKRAKIEDILGSVGQGLTGLRDRLAGAAPSTDYLTSLGQNLKTNPELGGALLGGVAGAGIGGIGTALSNKDKEEPEKRNVLSAMLTGGLAGGAAGGGAGLASRSWQALQAPGDSAQLSQLAGRVRELQTPPLSPDRAVWDTATGGLGAFRNMFPVSSVAAPLMGAADWAIHSQHPAMRMGERIGWGAVRSGMSRNVEHWQSGINSVLNKDNPLNLTVPQGTFLQQLRSTNAGKALLARRAASGTQSFGVPSAANHIPAAVMQQIIERGVQNAADSAHSSGVWKGWAHNQPNVQRSIGGLLSRLSGGRVGNSRDIVQQLSVTHPSRWLPRLALYGAPFAAETGLNVLRDNRNRDQDLRRLIAENPALLRAIGQPQGR